MHFMIRFVGLTGAICAATLWCVGCERGSAQSSAAPAPRAVERLTVEVVDSYPHDRTAFTQGLVLADGRLYESTGLVGQSGLREVEVQSGRVLRRVEVPPPYFAEGLALVDRQLFQLTWQNGKVFVYDAPTFERKGQFDYSGEGWGLCFDGRALVMSDGSSRLTFRGPETFRSVREITARLNGVPVERLNELECVGGDVYANIWTTERIVRIDARSGEVTATIDAAGLLSAEERAGIDVMNGIAHDPKDGTFLITGKLWPRLFRVRFKQ